MEILERFKFKEKEYICIQELFIEGITFYVCRDIETRKTIYLKENSGIELVNDSIDIEKIEKLIYAKSKDYIL